VRDRYESALVAEFRAQGKPVLGVCRGIQLLNVALGGSLYQDIPSQVPGSSVHRDWEVYEKKFHDVSFAPGARLERLYPGLRAGKVNSVHHQAVKRLAPGLAVEASSPDGLVEAFRAVEGPYLYAVQWHPEFMDPADGSLLDGRPILEDFLKQVSR
jgi:putative glutamine amidotransferase